MPNRQVPSNETSQRVRQRDRFKCKACGSFGPKQRAHIVPDSRGGSVEVDNLVWMCEDCQRLYEPAHLSGFMYDQAVRNMIRLRDTPALDSLVAGIFDELLASPDLPVTIEAGNVSMVTETAFSEPEDSWQPSFLKFHKDQERIHIEGRLKNENGFVILEFKDGKIAFHTKDIWDIVRKPRFLRTESKTRQTWFQVKQRSRDGVVEVSGEVYAGGGKLKFSRQGLVLPNGARISNLTLVGNSVIGLGQGSPLPQPYGHMNPNVI